LSACMGNVQVRMLIGLIRKVTGVTISAFFKDQTGYKYSGREMEMPWHNRSGFGHNIRKYRMRSAIHFVSFHFLPFSLGSGFHFMFYLSVWGVEPVVIHQTSWLESTGVCGVQQICGFTWLCVGFAADACLVHQILHLGHIGRGNIRCVIIFAAECTP